MKSKKHAKMKNKMNKTMKFLSMAALALVGAVMTGCSNDDIVDIDQPGNDNIERLTVVANLDGSTTRALDTDGKKTYNVGDKIAVVYKNTSGNTVKAESDALTDGDITGSGKSAKFTVTLVDADKNENVTYIYPSYMAKDDGTVNYDALYNEQDGTLATLASKFDYCEFTGAWNGEKLPTATLANQLVICEYTLKNSTGLEVLNANVTAMTISDGTNVYIINRTAGAGSIYVVIKPTTSANINYTATTNDGKVWTKSVTGKTYGASEWCPLGLKMSEEQNMVAGLFSISANKRVYFAKGNLQATTTDKGESWTWGFAAHQWDYVGNAAANNAVNGNGTVSINGTVDLFGWSTSETYFGIHNSGVNSAYYGDFRDWGNVPGIGSGWRTLSGGEEGEWYYLFNTRSASTVNETANARFAKGQVNGVHGVILFPDNYTHPSDVDVPVGINNTGDAGWNGNGYDIAEWAKMEAAGCVFLPTTGYSEGGSVYNVGALGRYWSSTTYITQNGAYALAFESTALDAGHYHNRYNGRSVRLVRDVVAP